MQNNRPYREKPSLPSDIKKAKLLCYSALYPGKDDEFLDKIIRSKNAAYAPFKSYLRLAKKAAETKQSIGASFNLVNRDIDYKLYHNSLVILHLKMRQTMNQTLMMLFLNLLIH